MENEEKGLRKGECLLDLLFFTTLFITHEPTISSLILWVFLIWAFGVLKNKFYANRN